RDYELSDDTSCASMGASINISIILDKPLKPKSLLSIHLFSGEVMFMVKENVSLYVNYEGKTKEELSAGLDQAVERALLGRTGLKVADVSFKEEDVTYTVTLKTKGEYVGMGPSLDDALTNALTQKQELSDYTLEVSVEKTAEVPYFTIPLHVRSLKPVDLELYHQDAVGQLVNTYGKRVALNPEYVEYKVLKTKLNLKDDKKLPKSEEIREKVILADGVSMKSIEDAEKVAQLDPKKVSKVKSTIYELRSRMIVYGQEEESAFAGAPAVITKRSPRAASPAAADPLYFSSAVDLM
ncbi:MAG: hypothetical protein Q8R37_05785, partial [Nanoarchaeota archaeon]|nr:hypothetical protein [Nanoarchaeota archaeon]